MLVLVTALMAGLVAGFVAGGRLQRISGLRLRVPWLVLVALALQLVAFGPIGEHLAGGAAVVLHLFSYALLIAFALLNLGYLGVRVMTVGLLCNAAAVFANGGFMPASRTALLAAGQLYAGDTSNNSRIAETGGHLLFLGDVFWVPSWLPLANVFSPGDVAIAVGIALLLAMAMADRGGALAWQA
jgi:hypothetical protein